MKITLDDVRKKQLVEEIQSYFRNEHDENIGDLKAEMFLEFFIENLGPKIYNQALSDASSFIQDKLVDLEDMLSVPE